MASSGHRDLPYRPCAGVVLIDGAGQVFAGRRIGLPDAWQMPQGGINKGESPRQAALRELREEIGTNEGDVLAETSDWLTYDLPEELLGTALKGRYRGQKQKWFAVRFAGTDADIDVQGVDHPEFDAWAWMMSKDLIGHTVPFKRDVYAYVFDEFGMFLT